MKNTATRNTRSSSRSLDLRSRRESARSSSSRKPKAPQRTSFSRASEDDAQFVPPSKCRCESCQLRTPSAAYQLERDRIVASRRNVLKEIDQSIDDMISDLEQLVKFQSISVEPEKLLESCKALDWMANRLTDLKFKTYDYPIADNPSNCFADPHQKVLFARYFSSPSKNTLLIYGHLDVLPVQIDCWISDPFKLIAKDNLLYGRGVTSGKGMIVGWLQAIECWLKVHNDLPINIKFIVDMLHEVGSTGLQTHITAKSDFFVDVDFVVFDVNSWVNNINPIVPCSLTGWAHFGVEVRGANKNLESGLASGLVYEPMIDLCHLMNGLVNDEHEIQIPGIEINTKRLSTAEWHLLESAEFRTYEYREDLFVRRLRFEDNKVEFLQNRWCKPTLTMHGVVGADSHPGCRRILPMKVIGKFSIKLVPDQEVKHVFNLVKDHMRFLKVELNVSTQLNVHLLDGIDPLSWTTDSKLIKAVCRAVESVYERDVITTHAIPICLPIANVLQKLVNKPIILLPYSKRIDKHHHENESIESLNVSRHTKTCAALFAELSTLRPKCKCNVLYQYCNLRGVQEILDAERNVDLNEVAVEKKWYQFTQKAASSDDHPTRSRARSTTYTLKKYLLLPFRCKRKIKRRHTQST
ncbi:PREDICTED: cytosolic non-specific dipeptidase-like [Drosophila arizonae]|uniref:Cytosolic non-specific dipeptidase-like n=1 Tax=Drosophila arizonae TaxID=7263 RepID=A0ABM1NPH1_DROAR|nr:PREDICTED: cytosolic non-specific dipeptidase-like [Drosophila arizonae]